MLRKQICTIDMNRERINNYILNYTEQKLASGRMFFTQAEFRQQFESYSEVALTSALNRLIKKGKVISIHKGFYLIIPPERMAKGMLPPSLFIDSLMSHLGREYYVGLLSAAAYQGASHQQSQEYFVFIGKPAIRGKNEKGLKLNFVVKSNMVKVGVEKRKTETGYINVSSAELTALDIVNHQNKIGGINRVVSILSELIENMKANKMKELLVYEKTSAPTLQRLGFILEKLNENELAEVVFNSIIDKRTSKVPLKIDADMEECSYNRKWKIIENVELDLEF